MLDLICTGEALIDLLADRPGVTITEAHYFTWAPGGAPANVAVAAAKLGLDTGFLGKLGDDPFGRHMRDIFRQHDVNTDALILTQEARTALAFVALPTPDNPQFSFYRNPSADILFRPEEVNEEYVRQARAFQFGSISLIEEPGRSATLKAVEVAKEAGALISFDPNYRPALWPPDKAKEEILATLPLCDVLKLNESEVELLTGETDPVTGGRKLLAGGPRLCLVTQGAAGSLYITAEGSNQVPSFPVEAVDATGCGDGFMAGVLKGLLARSGHVTSLTAGDLTEILRYANAVGALTALKKGAIPALPLAREVADFLSQQK